MTPFHLHPPLQPHERRSRLHSCDAGNPADTTLRLIFADWLEEQRDPRAELLRLMHTLTQSVEVPDRNNLEDRLRSLVAGGVKPVGPFWTNSLGWKFAWLPAGTFLMGSPEKEQGRQRNETQHKVTLTNGFFLSIHPVTQACWREVMGNNPSYFQGDNLPVEQVSWDDCQAFLSRLSVREGQPYRSPTEAEWEFACRAGTTTPFYFGDVITTDEANYDGRYYENGKKGVDREKTTPVGSFPANAFGLHDSHGNVWEWCQDWFGEHPLGDSVDPHGSPEGERRVMRGGSFESHTAIVRSAFRGWYDPRNRDIDLGFRAVRDCSP